MTSSSSSAPAIIPPPSVEERRGIPRRLAAAEAIRADIAALTDDAEVVRDTLEGEFDFDHLIDFLLNDIAYNKALCEAIEHQRKQLEARSHRLERRTEAARAALRKGLEIADIKRCERPMATVYLGRQAPSLGEIDEALVPTRFWKEQAPTLDRRALLEALKAKEAVPGAQLAPEGVSLKISTR